MLSQKLQAEVAKAAHKHYQLSEGEVEVQPVRDMAHGDFTSNAALKIASKWGVPAKEAAEAIRRELADSRLVRSACARVEVAGPGFINFWLKPATCFKQLAELTKPAPRAILRGRRVLVEFSSPNIAKPMHVGHIRSTIIGAALANMFQALGAPVLRLNHLGDWGTQFGKLIAAYKRWGKREQVRRQPISEMLRLYVKFHEEMKREPELEVEGQQEFLRLEKGNRENRALWNWFKRESVKEFNVFYRRLGVNFTHVLGESFYEPMLKGVVTDLLRQKLAVRNEDGSVVVHLQAEGLPPCLIQKSDGGSLYATRDLAAIRYRVKRFKAQQILYVVGNEQSLHFDQVFAVAKLAGYAGNTILRHVKFGQILGEDKQKLATREGRIIPLGEVLDKARELARKVVQAKNPSLSAKLKDRIAETVGMGAVKYNDLSQNRLTDITFNWEKMLSLDGNSAPYLQYSYVRLKSILRKAGKVSGRAAGSAVLAHANEADLSMLRLLTRYPEQLRRAAEEQGPHLLAAYLYELATQVNSFYHAVPVLKAEPKLRSLRLNLVRVAADVLKEGLGILGIGVVEKM
ncbi:MAG: arginine--tRNA ligase [Candidatus Veblenbacteria bacterium]|nr:arginine--tRNA ligase [Candidatus Veblenbacteria bacterium]